MLSILAITFPIFALIGVGYLITWKGVLRPEQMPVLGVYNMNVALPPLIFTSVATRPPAEVLHVGYLSAMVLGALITMTLVVIWLRLSGNGARRAAIGAMGSTCPNSIFIGYSILILALPDVAGPVLAMNLLAENFVIVPAALTLLEMSQSDSGHGGVVARIRTALLNVLKRPFIIALLLGLAVSLSGVPMPEPLMRALSMLGASAPALALIIIGGSLVGVKLEGNLKLALQIMLGKLVLSPLVVTAVIALAMALGLPFSPELRAALILTMAMPMITIFTVFAQEVGHAQLAALAQLVTTAAAFVTISAALFLLT